MAHNNYQHEFEFTSTGNWIALHLLIMKYKHIVWNMLLIHAKSQYNTWSSRKWKLWYDFWKCPFKIFRVGNKFWIKSKSPQFFFFLFCSGFIYRLETTLVVWLLNVYQLSYHSNLIGLKLNYRWHSSKKYPLNANVIFKITLYIRHLARSIRWFS